MASVEISHLRKEFGKNTIIPELSLQVPDGSFTVLVGPSGCGKSTLLRLIAGLEEVTSGQIAIGGRDVSHLPGSQRELAMVFQSYALYPHMSVADNMRFGLKLTKLAPDLIEERIAKAAELLQMTALLARKPSELSGGQRQRVAIGRAIVREPKVFLFDEPLSNLDASLRGQMRIELTRLHKRLGCTIIYVTHDQVEAMTMADQIVVMKGGVIQQVGAPMDLYHQPGNAFVAGFIGSPPINFITGDYANRQGAAQVGIRPEHIDLSHSAGEWQAAITDLEVLGADTLAIAQVSGIGEITVELSGETRISVGEVVYLTPKPGRMLCFDAAGVACGAKIG